MTLLILILSALTMLVPFGIFLSGAKTPGRFKKTLAVNIVSFFVVLLFGTIVHYAGYASAAEAAPAAASVQSNPAGLAYIAAAVSTGLSCIGAGIAISAAASAAIGALSENEGLMGKALIFVALAEGVAIYGLIISIMILGSI